MTSLLKRTAVWSLALPIAAIAGCASNDQDMDPDQRSIVAKPTFNADGTLNRPSLTYREWVYVGTPLTPNSLNPPEAPFPDFHNVYIPNRDSTVVGLTWPRRKKSSAGTDSTP